MSISYNGIVNYGKAILPSVESWGSNNNILRDPPRSITTRRIDKVSETSMIDQDIQESGNRVAESIRVYPRGINPMVGVSFDNNSSNAGMRTGQGLLYAGGQQTKLPYRVAMDGAFRAPILRQENLMPLSRLPRNVTKVNPVVYTADFKKKLVCPGTAKDYRSVKNDIHHIQTKTQPFQKMQKAQEIYTKQNIADPIMTDANTIKIQNIQRPVQVAVGQNIQNNNLLVSGRTSKIRNVQRPVKLAVGQNIQDTILVSANGTKIQNIQRPVELAVGQNIQDTILVSADGTKIQNIQRPVELAVGQNIQDTILVSADGTKIQNIQRPVELAVGQNIQDTILVSADGTKIQNIQRPVELAVGQNIQDTILVSADGTKIQNIQRPVELAVGQNIQNNNLLISGRTAKIQNIQRPVELSVGQSINDNSILVTDIGSGKQYRKDFSNHSNKYVGDTIKTDTLHIDANVNPNKNINVKTVESKITYYMSERPQSQTSTTSNSKGITKHIHHEIHEFRDKPSLHGEVNTNSSYQGMINPKEQLVDKVTTLPNKLNMGERIGMPSIPTFERNQCNKKLKSGTFFELMKKK